MKLQQVKKRSKLYLHCHCNVNPCTQKGAFKALQKKGIYI